MPLVSCKGTLAIAAVIDVVMHSSNRPVSARALAARHKLPPRHLEPVLQALVRDGILKGIRGPHGGYEIARDTTLISVEDILNSVARIEELHEPLPASDVVGTVVQPALAVAERCFSAALRDITVADLARQAVSARVQGLGSFDRLESRFG